MIFPLSPWWKQGKMKEEAAWCKNLARVSQGQSQVGPQYSPRVSIPPIMLAVKSARLGVGK